MKIDHCFHNYKPPLHSLLLKHLFPAIDICHFAFFKMPNGPTNTHTQNTLLYFTGALVNARVLHRLSLRDRLKSRCSWKLAPLALNYPPLLMKGPYAPLYKESLCKVSNPHRQTSQPSTGLFSFLKTYQNSKMCQIWQLKQREQELEANLS